MKKMFVVSFVLAAALAVGCGKKQAQTTPTNNAGGNQTEMKNDATGGATYGGTKADPGGASDPCAAPAPK